jgi:NAD(P)-dependent dehydrogenase (short-subunit alcohol dehydrogenase family)
VTSNPFDLTGKTALVTGGYGVLGGTLAGGLAASGARVAVLGRRHDLAAAKADEIRAAGGTAMPVVADVLERDAVRLAMDEIEREWGGGVDILVNAAGGNVARARNDARSIFEVPMDAFDEVLRLNLHGTVVPSLVVGESMAHNGRGTIINISSMAATAAISGTLGYSVAKSGVDSFTRWMAMDLARKHGDGIRVNAIAPGFFVSTQNRAVLIDDAGEPTARARTIIQRTPMGRFGRPDELVGAAVWLASDASSFVTGIVIPVDGGFSSFSGV